MGMILGHHIPGGAGIAPASDSCSYSVKSDDPTPEPFSTPGGSRRDVRIRADGLRAWTHWTVENNFNDTHQYDISPAWSLLQANWTPSGDINRVGEQNRSMDWHNDGNNLTFVSRWFSSFFRIDDFDMSATPYDISSGLGPGVGSTTALIGGEYLGRWSLDGLHLFVSSLAVDLRRYNMAVAHDLSSVTGFDQLWNYGPFAGSTNTLEFSADHTRIYLMRGSPQTLMSFDLTDVDDISAPFNKVVGPDTNLPTNLQVGRGMNIRPDTGDLILLADQNNQRIRCWTGGIAPTVDDDFSSVVLLLDFEGPQAGTNITDLSNSGHPETFVDNAQIDTFVTALGQNTLLLDGTGDLITFPDSADWDFGTGDFTIEFNVDLDTIAGTQSFMGNYLTGSGADKGIVVQLAAGSLRVLRGDDVLASVVWAGAAIDTDFHIAVSRSGTDLRIFVDGSELVSVTDSSDFTGSVQPWRIGSLDGSTEFVDGNVGAVRVTKAVARYAAPFTPSPCFYPHPDVTPSLIFAVGSPTITKPTSTGEAIVSSTALVEAGATVFQSGVGVDLLLPPSPTEAIGDRIFAFGGVVSFLIEDGSWEELNTAPFLNFVLYTKIAQGGAPDQIEIAGSLGGDFAGVGKKFTFKDIAGPGSWDFNAQGLNRSSLQTTFNVRSMAAFGIPAPSISIWVGVRNSQDINAASLGIFSDNAWTIPPNGGVILNAKTTDANPPNFATYWHAINFNVQAVKTTYPDTGEFWAGAAQGSNITTTSSGWRYDHD